MSISTLSDFRQLALDLTPPDTDEEMSFDIYPIDQQFPESFANVLSHREVYNKHLFRPNTYLHKWWARRCGTTFRTILKQLVREPAKRDYYAPGGLEGMIILDPMMGGGTTLHEAIRMGANVIGVDVDPIPVLQARATLSRVSIAELTEAFQQFFDDLQHRAGPYFQTECPKCHQTIDSQYTLYGIRKHCACGEVVQVDQFELRYEQDRTLRISPNTWEIIDNEEPPSLAENGGRRLITKKETHCPTCGQKYQDLIEIPYYDRYTPIAVAGVCPQHGFFLRSPGAADRDRIAKANALRSTLDFAELADFSVQSGPKSRDLLRRNVHSYLDVFSSRQLLYLSHAINALQSFENPVKLNLALLISTSLEFNSMLCGYKGWAKNRPGAIRHVFAHHAYSFPYTAAENNPVNPRRASGNLQSLFANRIVRGKKWAIQPMERLIDQQGGTKTVKIPGELDGGVEVSSLDALKQEGRSFLLLHRDARDLPLPNESVDFVVTDPPYYDSVQYSDLATFFHVWLAHLLPSEMDWRYDQSNSAVANDQNDKSQFKNVLGGVFGECQRVLKPDGRMIFTYHHWDPNAWSDLTFILKKAGFRLINRYVVFSENPISVHIRNLKAIKHDTILIFAKQGAKSAKPWPPLSRIDTEDSETFCRQCGEALGWMLDDSFSEENIRGIWNQLIRRN